MRGLTRRSFSASLVMLAAVVSTPLRVFARNEQAFEAASTDDVMSALFGDKEIRSSDRVKFKAPEIAEDGSIVPVSVETDLDAVKTISLLVDANPNPLSARFHYMPGSIPQFKTRIKMGESSDVRAIVETEDALYVATRNIKVTLGGCGG